MNSRGSAERVTPTLEAAVSMASTISLASAGFVAAPMNRLFFIVLSPIKSESDWLSCNRGKLTLGIQTIGERLEPQPSIRLSLSSHPQHPAPHAPPATVRHAT